MRYAHYKDHVKSPYLLVAIIALSAAGSLAQSQGVARIPPATIDPPDSAAVTNYSPSHAALGWTRSGQDLLVAHRETYSWGDVSEYRCTESGIFAAPIDGGEAQLRAQSPALCGALQASDGVALDLSGDLLAYVGDRSVNQWRLFVLRLSNGERRQLPAPCEETWGVSGPGAWSPRGDRIAIVSGCDHPAEHAALYLLSPDGGRLRRLAPPTRWGEEDPAWAPDGGRVAFTQYAETHGKTSIVIMDTLGQGRRVLASGWGPAWSPDGQWIAFLREERLSEFNRIRTIRIVRPNGRDDRELFHSSDTTTMSRGWGAFLEGQPWGPLLWSPDSRWLIFSRIFHTGTTLWRVRIEDGHLDQITIRREPPSSASRDDGA
jgi:hypothetical protein